MVTEHKKYWLAITDELNLEIIKKNGIYATNSETKYRLLNVGDSVIMYLIPKRICGIFEITKLKTNKKEKFSVDKYKYYFEIKSKLYSKNYLLIIDKWNDFDLIANISIFKNAKRWGSVLMGKSIIQIGKKDFDIIERKLLKRIGKGETERK